MKIIHISWALDRYGIATFLFNLMPYQNRNFSDLSADIILESNSPAGEEGYKELGCNYYCLGLKTAKSPTNLFKIYNAYKIIKNYDIVNLHSASLLSFISAKLARKKVIYTFHGTLGLRGKWYDIITKIFHYHFLAPYCDYFTFASRASYERYLKGFYRINLNPQRFKIFPYGIKVDAIKPKRSSDEIRAELRWQGKFIIGTAARIDPVKRLEYLIEAFRNLEKKDDYLLAIIGKGDENYEFYLRKLVNDYNLEKYVQFLGYRKDVYDILNCLDVFVLPSLNEPFGLALLEAMTLGIPSIVFQDGGGAVDVLGDSGFIVNSVNELAETIKRLKGDIELRNRTSKSVKERAKLFDISYTAERFYSLYRILLKKSII